MGIEEEISKLLEKEIKALKDRLGILEIQLAQLQQRQQIKQRESEFTVFTPRLFDSGKRAKSESIGRPAIEIGQGE